MSHVDRLSSHTALSGVILAPSHKFIFIHVPKAAGTSLNAAFSAHDVFYPIRHEGEAGRRRFAAKLDMSPDTAALDQHASARNFIDTLGREAYDTFYAFAFVRNPWDVAVSWFHYRYFNPQIDGHAEALAAGTFRSYAMTVLAGADGARRVGLQHRYVIDDAGAIAVKFVGRYERLTEDFANVVATLGIETLPLDHFNQSHHPPWSTLYDRDTFSIVANLVDADAAMFGYSSDPAAYGL